MASAATDGMRLSHSWQVDRDTIPMCYFSAQGQPFRETRRCPLRISFGAQGATQTRKAPRNPDCLS